MSNNQLPAEVHRRIEQDAKEKYTGHSTLSIANKNGYIAGATAEAIRTADEIDKALHAERNKMQLKFSEADKQWADLLKQQDEKAQMLADALEKILKQRDYYSVIELAANALQQWKEGKEVGNG